MINFRYHVVSLIAVFLALAISPVADLYGDFIADAWHDFTFWLRGLR